MNTLWTNPKVTEVEFSNPNKMAPSLIKTLNETRDWINKPMTFTRSANGTIYHPHGDAVGPWSSSHAKGSLHKFDCDHDRTAEIDNVVVAQNSGGLAQDWDCGTSDPEELFDIFLLLERLNVWNGIGLYPHWNRPGFHTDLRTNNHPHTKARWFRLSDGTYHKLTWQNWKHQVLLDTHGKELD